MKGIEMADMVAIAAGVLTFGGLVGGYALARSYRAAVERLQRERDGKGLRRAFGAGQAVGGHNRPGDN
jgi:hypothetical protein